MRRKSQPCTLTSEWVGPLPGCQTNRGRGLPNSQLQIAHCKFAIVRPTSARVAQVGTTCVQSTGNLLCAPKPPQSFPRPEHPPAFPEPAAHSVCEVVPP